MDMHNVLNGMEYYVVSFRHETVITRREEPAVALICCISLLRACMVSM